MLKSLVAALAITMAAPALLPAQDPAPQGTPAPRATAGETITGSASADARFVPDRATLRISVQTKAATAAAAGAENARRQNAVLSSLRSLGLSNDQLSTVDYNVSPEYRYDQGRSTLTGYTVTNTVVADIRDLKQLGAILDAALSNGANLVSSLDFYSSNTDAARRQAVSEAVTRARAEAEVAARAAGGTLGSLVHMDIVNSSSAPPPRPMYAMAAKAAESTPINPGQQTLTVEVNATWRFAPAPAR